MTRRFRLALLGFLSPWLLGVGLFALYPLASIVYFSFTHFDQINPPEFVGARNWAYVFTGFPAFWAALRNTVWLIVVMVSLRVAFGLGVATLVVRVKRGAALLRTILYLPCLAPPVAATIGFVFLLNPATGPVDDVLHAVGLPAPGWFDDPHWAKPGLTLMALWAIGDLMVIFMAALLDVPASLHEAATLDGAGPWQRFRYVTLPTIRPVLLFAVVIGVIETTQYYTQAFVAGAMASGVSPTPGNNYLPGYPDGSTLTLPQLIYTQGFLRFDTGSACVIALVLFALCMAVTALLFRRGFGLADPGSPA